MTNLLSINVSDKIEKKNNLSYLSWAYAWGEVLKIDENATWETIENNGLPVTYLRDDTAMVKTSVTILKKTKTCILPVMNHMNKAIVNPNAFEINKNIMRCLAKNIAMFGLGLYIYAGEDLPEGEAERIAEEKSKAQVVIKEKTAFMEKLKLAKTPESIDTILLSVKDNKDYDYEKLTTLASKLKEEINASIQ